MIKVGFICEGNTEKKLLESEAFKAFLASIDLQFINVIDAEGSGNLLPHNIQQYITSLERDGAEKIIILTDLDADVCITITKQRLRARDTDIVVIAVRQIEAWFLADSLAMQKLLQDSNFHFDLPENEAFPFECIRQLKIAKTNRGFNDKAGGKLLLIKKLLDLGLDIQQSASHPNCASAAYFVRRLKELSPP